MAISNRVVDELKSAGHFFAAGAVAQSLKHPRSYGCHFGMRSTRDADAAAFLRGYDAATR